MSIKKIALLATITLSPIMQFAGSFYKQTNDEFLAKQIVELENPTKSELRLMTTCLLLENHGKAVEPLSKIRWQAVLSTRVFAELFPKIDKTSTLFGRMGLLHLFTQPTDNLEELEKKTALVKYFEIHEEELDQLEAAIQNSIEGEERFLDLCKEKNKKELTLIAESDSFAYYNVAGLSKLNEDEISLETGNRIKEGYATAMLSGAALAPGIMVAGGPRSLIASGDHNMIMRGLISIKNFIISGVQYAAEGFKELANYNKNNYRNTYNQTLKGLEEQNIVNQVSPNIIAFSSVLNTAILYFSEAIIINSLYQYFSSSKKTFDVSYDKQADLIQIAKIARSIQSTATLIQTSPELSKYIPENKLLLELFNKNSESTSKDLKKLIKKLTSSSFEGNGSYLFSKQGKILATHKLLMRIKSELVPYLQAFGAIDAYVSIHKLYASHKDNKNGQFCIPTFVKSEKPQIIAKDFWHPFISPEAVITNSLSLGTEKGSENLVITGPNAGGKTTTLTALMINIIMAQSFGVAPAVSLELTPFAKLHSYIDITTNLAEGESLFQAEVNRSKQLKESIDSCKDGEKAFTVIDEIFSGTNPDVASKVGFEFLKERGDDKHNITIVTTHFPRITDLEQETKFYENFKVADAEIKENGSISYPFKLVKGKSTQNIAEHMLRSEGLLRASDAEIKESGSILYQFKSEKDKSTQIEGLLRA